MSVCAPEEGFPAGPNHLAFLPTEAAGLVLSCFSEILAQER